jgi:hypothetical protein
VRIAVASIALAACGGAAAPPPATPASPPAASPEAPPDAAASAPNAAASEAAPSPGASSAGVPSACADPADASVCTPASAFVDRLCAKGPRQDIALALFGKTPFTRMYLRGKIDELVFDEEVLALRFHGVPKNGIQVGSAAGSYDVLRWDGSCSIAVDAQMFSRTRPPKPKTARVQWHRIGDKTQDALIAGSDEVKRAHSKRGKECRGAMTGDVSASCAKADASLVGAIVEYVRSGGALPPPDAP